MLFVNDLLRWLVTQILYDLSNVCAGTTAGDGGVGSKRCGRGAECSGTDPYCEDPSCHLAQRSVVSGMATAQIALARCPSRLVASWSAALSAYHAYLQTPASNPSCAPGSVYCPFVVVANAYSQT